MRTLVMCASRVLWEFIRHGHSQLNAIRSAGAIADRLLDTEAHSSENREGPLRVDLTRSDAVAECPPFALSGRPQQRHLPVGPDPNAVIRIRDRLAAPARGQRAATCGSKWMVLVLHCS